MNDDQGSVNIALNSSEIHCVQMATPEKYSGNVSI